MEKGGGIAINDGIAIGKIFFYSGEQEWPDLTETAQPFIVAAQELTPSEILRFSKLNVAAFILKICSANSHTSILTRAMDLPAVFHIEVKKEWNCRNAVVDGYQGVVIIDPDDRTLSSYKEEKVKRTEEKKWLLDSYRGKKAETKSGKQVRLYGNINRLSDVQQVIQNDGEGIGVFKTEFLYLEASDFPTEEEQFNVYRKVAASMKGKKVVLRTLDIGADKTADYFHLEIEENPAMGLRAIRLCLERPDIFVTQLRAMLRASAFGDVSIMYPMVVSAEEVLRIKAIVKEVMEGLRKEKIPFDENIEQGIMVETPAAVIMSRELAEIVDFFSIGTNDLTQYTLAMDRQNPRLEEMADPLHPAILRSIKTTIENAHKAGIWVSISGELGANTSLVKMFVVNDGPRCASIVSDVTGRVNSTYAESDPINLDVLEALGFSFELENGYVKLTGFRDSREVTKGDVSFARLIIQSSHILKNWTNPHENMQMRGPKGQMMLCTSSWFHWAREVECMVNCYYCHVRPGTPIFIESGDSGCSPLDLYEMLFG